MDVARGLWQLRAGLQRRRDWGNGSGVAGALDPVNRYESDRWNLDLTYHNPNYRQHWDIKAQVSFFDTSQEVDRNLTIFPPGVDLGAGVYPEGFIGNPEVFERHHRANIASAYSGFQRHRVRVGAGYYYGDLHEVRETKNFGVDPNTGELLAPGADLVEVTDTPYVFLRETRRENFYAYIQDIWQLADDWELTAGVRIDNYSDFGSTTNPRLALVWSTSRNLTTKVLYGRAFRSPAFNETQSINNPVSLGNPELDPETLETYELAFDYRPNENLRLGLNLFLYDWDDIIEYIPDSDAPTSSAQNAGKHHAVGGEIEISWKINSNITLNTNYALQHAEDKNMDSQAHEAPRQQVFVGLDWQMSELWQLHSRVNWVMDRPRQLGDIRPDIDDYRQVDLNLRRRSLDGHWGISLQILNLLDSDIRENSPWSNPQADIPYDLPRAGRRVVGEVTYRF
jgi:iron complex outermembrane receptor protein